MINKNTKPKVKRDKINIEIAIIRFLTEKKFTIFIVSLLKNKESIIIIFKIIYHSKIRPPQLSPSAKTDKHYFVSTFDFVRSHSLSIAMGIEAEEVLPTLSILTINFSSGSSSLLETASIIRKFA